MLSLVRTGLAGIILSALPVLSLASQSLTAPNIMTVDVPAQLIETPAGVRVSTAFNTLALSKLAGVTTMRIGDVVYIHIYQRGGIAQYAYAISQNRPAQTDENTLTLRGVVMNTDADRVQLDYLLADVPNTSALSQALKTTDKDDLKTAYLKIGVNRRAVAHIKSITLKGEVFQMH